MRTLTPELHQHFLTRAKRVSGALASALEAIGPIGYHRRSTSDLGVHLARMVVGQQLSTHAASTIWGRVTTAVGESQVLEFCIPDNYDTLRGCGLSNNKVKALLSLRDAEAAGALNVKALSKLTTLERNTALVRLRGIGPWTADMVSMFFFHEPDIWPLGDLAVRKTFERYVSADARHDVETGAALFAPYRSFLALYMWRIANNGPL